MIFINGEPITEKSLIELWLQLYRYYFEDGESE